MIAKCVTHSIAPRVHQLGAARASRPLLHATQPLSWLMRLPLCMNLEYAYLLSLQLQQPARRVLRPAAECTTPPPTMKPKHPVSMLAHELLASCVT